jgi:hypothetical protein
MKVDFDGLRCSVALNFDDVFKAIRENKELGFFVDYSLVNALSNLRGSIGAMLCVYNDDDVSDLSDKCDLLPSFDEIEDLQ